MKTINLIGAVGWDITNERLMRELPKDKSEPVRIFVDSYGGVAFEGFSIFNTLDKRQNLFVEIGAMAFSAASYWMFATDPDKVTVNKNSSWMAHNASDLAYGDRHEIQKKLTLLGGLDNIIADTYAAKLGMSKKQVMSKMDDEFWLFGGQEIIDAGIASVLREGPADNDDEMLESSEIIENFRAIFNEKMSHKPDKPTDYNLLNFMINDFTKRKEIKVEDQRTNQMVAAAAAQAPAVQNIANVGTPVPAVAPVAPAVDNTAAITAAVTAERTRILNLIELSDVKLNELATSAINDATDAGTFAIAQLKAKNAAPAVPVPVADPGTINPAAPNTDIINIGVAPTAQETAQKVHAKDVETAQNKAEKKGDDFYDAWKKNQK